MVSKGITTCLLKLFSTMCIFGLFTFDAHASYQTIYLKNHIGSGSISQLLYERDEYRPVGFTTKAITKPSADGYTFMGYSKNGGVYEQDTTNLFGNENEFFWIDSAGAITSFADGMMARVYTSGTVDLYSIWARDCVTDNPGTNCTRKDDTGVNGSIKYTTYCDKGADIDRGGTYNPICKAKFDQDGGTDGVSSLYVCNDTVGHNVFCNASDCKGCPSLGNNTVSVPIKDKYTFKGYYSGNTQIIDKNGIQVYDVKHLTSWTFKAKWVDNPCKAGYYYDKDSDDCDSCKSQEKGGETYSFTSIDGPHDKTKEDVCYVDNDESHIYEDTIGRYTLYDGSGGNCTLGQFNGN